ncbi:MAG: NAD-dependent epimerase/dehydratase family protein [Gemmatimonadota bacterium]
MTATVLVTGANGFIGRALTAELARRGLRVRAAVRRPSAVRIVGADESVVVGEISGTTDWTEALRGVDCVVNLAALAHRIGADAASADYEAVNTHGATRLAIGVADARGVRRMIQMSSVAVTGSASSVPVNQSSMVSGSLTAYGRSKLLAESAIVNALSGTAADYCILRPPLVYGPGNPGNMARLLRLVESGRRLPLAGINNRRSFLYVGNLVTLIAETLDAAGASRRVFTVADREVVSTTELVELIASVSGRKLRLFHLPRSVLQWAGLLGDGAAWLTGRSFGIDSYSVDRLLGSLEVDSGAAEAALNWRPPFTLEQGLRLTLGSG